MQFKDGASVFNAEGEKVGTIDRVVIDPKGGEVTHVVVRKGFIFSEDKVLPVDAIHWSQEDEIHLKGGLEDLDTLPEFREVEYVPLDQEEVARRGYEMGMAPPVYWYPAAGSPPLMWGSYTWGYMPPGAYMRQATRIDENIPEGTVPLKEGARVVGQEGKDVGSIERVIVDPGDDQVTHLVVTKGFLDKTKKLIPANWIDRIKEDSVQLSVNARFVDKLKEFED